MRRTLVLAGLLCFLAPALPSPGEPTETAPPIEALPSESATATPEPSTEPTEADNPQEVAESKERIEYKLDRNEDGVEDTLFWKDATGSMLEEQLDTNFDGSFDMTTIYENGVVGQRRIESERTGIPRRIEYYETGKLTRLQIDENEDGIIDVWNFFDDAERLEKQERDRNHDGQIDTWIHFDPKTGTAETSRADRNGDGEVDDWTFYRNGTIYKRAEDLDGLGRATQLILYDEQGRKQYEELHSGNAQFPDEGRFFDARGEIQKRCKDRDGDGRFEIEESLSGGILQTRAFAQQRSKRIERLEKYAKGELSKVETDTTGDGTVNAIEYYRRGTKWRADEDSDGDGVLDWSFVNGKPADLSNADLAPLPRMDEIQCGMADSFWKEY